MTQQPTDHSPAAHPDHPSTPAAAASAPLGASHAQGARPAAGQVLQTVTVHARRQPWRRSVFDWAFAASVALAGLLAGWRLQGVMNGQEQILLLLTLAGLIALGWFWRPLAWLTAAAALGVAAAVALYQGDVQRAGQVFGLKYLLSSQSALLWMGVLVWMATLFHWAGLLGAGKRLTGKLPASELPVHQAQDQAQDLAQTAKQATAQTAKQAVAQGGHVAQRLGSRLAWAAVGMALIGSGVRWHESYLLNPQAGHIPLSNLYEVFVLFIWLTLLFGLYFENRRQARGLNAFVLLVASAAVAFLFWYSASRQGQLIQPLVPALQSWWMKLHVPANLVGYGMFALAAMAGLVSLLKTARPRALWLGLAGAPTLAAALLFALAHGTGLEPAKLAGIGRMALLLAALFAVLIALRPVLNPRTPAVPVLDDVMYKAIAVGFAFFTVATFTGALWAAEAWGAYWSWDPKEVWALIVWLNYAVWLHLRFIRGLRGQVAAWWALVGLLIVTFAIVGVNMFLGGMHSYGRM